jgi:hypothetical protein
MKFLMMLAEPTQERPLPSGFGDRARAWASTYTISGQRRYGTKLRGSSDARTIRVRNGEQVISPLPFSVGADERLAGIDILECDSLETAVAIAAEHPLVEVGAIEIRELWEDWQP